ncbi:hypothetical protein L2E82_25891 [Cichorium intybus]|uniref:Uncharacterized protein n=1 Tax=Cichorium intybus TaxID=13427 RepID=A0ACB9E4T3_CICIN|nr:hypothetical protein L2E82_25891 [Cichorium intybus]
MTCDLGYCDFDGRMPIIPLKQLHAVNLSFRCYNSFIRALECYVCLPVQGSKLHGAQVNLLSLRLRSNCIAPYVKGVKLIVVLIPINFRRCLQSLRFWFEVSY